MAITNEYLQFLEDDENSEMPKKESVLEVPKGKTVQEMDINHFKTLVKKKGFVSVSRALTNLEVFNSTRNPTLSTWAGSTRVTLESWHTKTFGALRRATIDPRQCTNCPEK